MKIIYLAIFAFLFASCWPTSLSFRDGSVPPEWKRFMVSNLDNKAANAPISYSSQLSELIKDGIQNRVGLTLVSDESDDPQISITGSVDSYNVTPLSLQENASEVKNRLTIRASFQIFISAPEEDVMELSSSRFADFDASQDVGAIQQQLLGEINDQIVQDVLNKLLSNW
ncbi:LPS assembly lipoprotein LptE [Brumimicrobium mesophilum]|uniref:LPS assembly lipoprotein LptE n=1 Tax=Brumimicrobium mesophilum TaxID=392717 RepID=UPI000D140F73|nr:LPS assembly lipoprotein LptE [Brumimicrobium mesophilum]